MFPKINLYEAIVCCLLLVLFGCGSEVESDPAANSVTTATGDGGSDASVESSSDRDKFFGPDGSAAEILAEALLTQDDDWMLDDKPLKTGRFDLQGIDNVTQIGCPTDNIWSFMAISPDGHMLAVAGIHQSLQLWNLDTLKVVNLKGLKSDATALLFTEDSRHLISSAGEEDLPHSCELVLWNSQTGKLSRELTRDDGRPFVDLCRLPGTNTIVATTHERLCRWNVESGQRIWESDAYGKLVFGGETISCSSSGHIVLHDLDGTIAVIDPQTLKEISTIQVDSEYLVDIECGPHDAMLMVLSERAQSFESWDTSTQQRLRVMSDATEIVDVSITKDRGLVASICKEGTLTLRNAQSGETVASILAHPLDPRHPGVDFSAMALEFTADGNRLVTLGVRGIRIWDVDALLAQDRSVSE